MNISYRWIRDLAPELDNSPAQLAERLAMLGAPVDEIVSLAAGLQDIRIARVTSTRPHPNADRLRICEVDAGTGEVLQVVCGAPNVRPDGIYPFAPVGAALPGGMAIKQARIRGELSQGMLCSERELELGRSHEGLMELRGDFTPGTSFIESVGLDDARIVVDVTANRADLLSHIGIARELAPGGRIALPAFPGAPEEAPAIEAGAEGEVAGVRIGIADAAGCSRYVAAVIRGVSVGPSPEWLAARLRAIGLRPINNVVDATNYVLFEFGQPLHAFDLARLAGPAVIVRRAAAGERIVTLDGVDRALRDDMLVIADAERPVAIAGVMGGRESEVGEATRDVLLECALFEPAGIRRTRRSTGLSTDASYRFERGVDPDGMLAAARRAVALIIAVAGGALEDAILDVAAERVPPRELSLRPARVAQVLGRDFTDPEIRAALEPIGFTVNADGEALRVRVPGYRIYDVTREIDLVEEVARRHGYENFADELRPFRAGTVPDAPLSRLEDRLREFLAGRGLLEARSASFAPAAEGAIELLNPLSAEESSLRGALLPGLVRRLEHNFAHGVRNVRLFEIGTVFLLAGDDGRPREETRVAAVLTGANAPPHWSAPAAAYDVWDLKGLLGELCEELGLPAAALSAANGASPPFAAGAGFQVADGANHTGAGGMIAPEQVDAPAWAGAVFGLELTLTAAAATPRRKTMTPLPVHPAVERDLALLVPRAATAAGIRDAIASGGGPLLEDVSIFDLYEGAGIPADTRSVAYRLRFRAPDRTLTDKEVDKVVDRMLRSLKEESGVERRA